jgi:hypothetical protein
LQLEFPESKVKELKALMQKCGLKTYHELFNNALTLTKWAVQETEQGRVILSQDDRTEKARELVMPLLEFVAAARREDAAARAEGSSQRSEHRLIHAKA